MVQQLSANFLKLCWRGPIQDVRQPFFERWTGSFLSERIRAGHAANLDTRNGHTINGVSWEASQAWWEDSPVCFILVVSTRWHRFFGLANGHSPHLAGHVEFVPCPGTPTTSTPVNGESMRMLYGITLSTLQPRICSPSRPSLVSPIWW